MSGRYLGIIPARGGSKGIPRKNLALLAGVPLIDYTIRAALDAQRLSRCVVSTDDAEIADHAGSLGAEVPFLRPPEHSADDTPMIDVLRHALRELGPNDFEAIVLLQPTSPLRTSEDIDEAIRLFETSGADSIVSVVPVPHNCIPESVMVLGDDERLRAYLSEARLLPRQRKPRYYARNGPAVLVTRTKVVMGGELYGPVTRPLIMDRTHSVDIDSQEDLSYAEVLLAREAL